MAIGIDFDSAIVASSDELVAAVLAGSALEAWPVDPDDSLAHDGDTPQHLTGLPVTTARNQASDPSW